MKSEEEKFLPNLDWKCFMCDYTDDISEFDSGRWKQGNVDYMTVRCPKCHHLQGRIVLGDDYDSKSLYDALVFYMRGKTKK